MSRHATRIRSLVIAVIAIVATNAAISYGFSNRSASSNRSGGSKTEECVTHCAGTAETKKCSSDSARASKTITGHHRLVIS